tara:strand:- start:248 stop:817 length:570 start_codon:yes stop_codon:yes gene_type:complete
MNIFVLCAGRCGSVSLYKICKHIKNYTSSHESREKLDFSYPKNHIEIDNRLCWFLGRLDEKYGDNAIYIHLKRDKNKIAESYSKRFYYKRGISMAYKYNLLRTSQRIEKNDVDICKDMIETIESNICLFLKDKTKTLEINLEKFKDDIPRFWNYINASGNLKVALKELEVKHNPTKKSIIKKMKNYLYK